MDILTSNGVKKKQELLLQYLKKITNKPTTEKDSQLLQLRKFQQEVEQKYKISRHNHTYKFPLENNQYSSDSSLNDIKDATVYDLKSNPQQKQINCKLVYSSKEVIDKSKLLLKIMSDKSMALQNNSQQRYKTELSDENRIQDLYTKSKLCNKSMNQQDQSSFIRPSVGKRMPPSNHTTRIQKIQVSQLIRTDNNDFSLQSRRSNNNSVQQNTHKDVLSLSFNINANKGKVQNYYISKFTKQKMDLFRLQQQSNNMQQQSPDLIQNYNSIGSQDSKISLKQFFSQKSPNNAQTITDQTNTINLKNKLAEMCKRQPLKLIK